MLGGSADSGGDENADNRKVYGKRELSTSKRAAQNRAAQVGFVFLFARVIIISCKTRRGGWFQGSNFYFFTSV